MSFKLIAGSDYIQMTLDGVISTVPNDPANKDWQVYQRWLLDGNTPQAAD